MRPEIRLFGIFLFVLMFLSAILDASPCCADDLIVDGGAVYTLTDPNSINYFAEKVGLTTSGTFNQNGGSNSAGSLYLGYTPTASGTYNLNGGTLSGTNLFVGYTGTGILNQTGGTNSVSNLYVGCYSPDARTGVGTYNLTGGSISSFMQFIYGTFNQTGGTNNAMTFSLNQGGTYNFSNGNMVSQYEAIGAGGTGTFNQTGGSHTITNTLSIGSFHGSGTFNLDGGDLTTGTLELVSGEFNLRGGSFSTGSYQMIGSNYYPGTGIFNQSGGTNTASNIYLGLGTGTGVYNLSDGVLTVARGLTVGGFGSGTFNQTGGSSTAANLFVGANVGGNGTYNLIDGTLSTSGNQYVGQAGTGTFNQTGGTNATANLFLGSSVLGNGTYNLSGGSLSASGDQYIGYLRTGTFYQTGGTNTADNLILGYNQAGSGTYSLSNGSLSATGTQYIGYSGNGAFNQTGGTNTTTNLFMGYGSGGNGTYSLSNGSLSIGSNQFIGNMGTGIFNQTGGTNATANLFLGNSSSGNGTYNLSGGSLSASGDQYIGYSGAGAFYQTGGTNSTNRFYIGYELGASGTYNLSGGSLHSINSEYIGYSGTGTFNQTGGTNTTEQSINVGNYYNGTMGSGTYNMIGGSIIAGGESIIGGNFNQSGGTNETNNVYLSRGGTYNLSGGSFINRSLTVGSWEGGTYNQAGGSLTTTSLTIGNTGAFQSSGTCNLNDGIISAGTLHIYDGEFNLRGGDLSTSGNQTIGDQGTGTFNQTGGTNTAANLILAYNIFGPGTYNLSGGSLSVSGDQYIGYWETGTFNQTGGTNATTNLVLGYNRVHNIDSLDQSSGTYGLSNGNLTAAGDQYIGYSGTGTFNQTGGTNSTQNLFLGYGRAHSGIRDLSDGFYNLSNGTLSARGDEFIGYSGIGTFNQTGGTNTVNGNLFIAAQAGSTGVYNLSGGTLTAGAIALNQNGTFSQTGGTLNAGVFSQQGGTVTANSFLENRGEFRYLSGNFLGRLMNYGVVNFNADFTAENGLLNNSTAPLVIEQGRTVALNGLGLDNRGGILVDGTLSCTDFQNTGSMIVNGTLSCSGSFVNSTNTFLSGSGTLQGNFVNSGNLNPGNSPGTLNVSGTFTQTAGGNLAIEIASPTIYDNVAVTGNPGTAMLAGTITPTLVGGYHPMGNTVFSGIVTAAGGISGTFDLLNPHITQTLFWEPHYDPTSFSLKVAREYTADWLGLTANQFWVGQALNALSNTTAGSLNVGLDAIDGLTTASAVQGALQQISADKAAAFSTLAFAGTELQVRTLSNRINSLRFADFGVPGNLGFNFNFASQGEGLMLACGTPSANASDSDGGQGFFLHQSRTGFFLEPSFSLGTRKTTANQTGYDFTIGGFTTGADFMVRDDLLVGVSSGYSHTAADFKNSGGDVSANSIPFNAYAAYFPKPFYAFGSIGYALNLFDLDRDISFGTFAHTAKSSTTGHQLNGYAETGYDVQMCRIVLTPYASLFYSRLWVDGFSETGADPFNLAVGSQDAESLQSGLGGRITAPFELQGIRFAPQVFASYQHEFSDDSRAIASRLTLGGNSFLFQTDTLKRDFVLAGGSLAAGGLAKNLLVQINYSAEIGRNDYTAHFISAGLRYDF